MKDDKIGQPRQGLCEGFSFGVTISSQLPWSSEHSFCLCFHTRSCQMTLPKTRPVLDLLPIACRYTFLSMCFSGPLGLVFTAPRALIGPSWPQTHFAEYLLQGMCFVHPSLSESDPVLQVLVPAFAVPSQREWPVFSRKSPPSSPVFSSPTTSCH